MAEPGHPEGPEGRLSTEDRELLVRWEAVSNRLRQLNDQLLADVRAEVGLPSSSFQVLCFLVASPERAAPMHQLSKLMGFSTAGTTGLVDRLAEAGLVERRPSCSDRRVTFAALTERGQEVAASSAKVFAESVRRRIVEPLGRDAFASLEAAVGCLDLADAVREPCAEAADPAAR